MLITQNDVISDLIEMIEYGNKINAKIDRAMEAISAYKKQGTESATRIAMYHEDELRGIKRVDVDTLEYKLEQIIKNN